MNLHIYNTLSGYYKPIHITFIKLQTFIDIYIYIYI